MAYYGIYSAGVALTASTLADTIKFQYRSASSLTASTVIGLEGDDVIYLGTQGQTTTGTSVGIVNETGIVLSGSVTGGVLRAQVFGSGAAVASGSTDLVTGTTTLSVVGVVTSQQAVRTFNASQLYGNQGNDTIAFGDRLTTVTASTFGGGAGSDFIGIINQLSAGAVATVATQAQAGTWTKTFIEGGGDQDTISLDAQNIALVLSATTIQGGQGSDSIYLSTNGALQGSQILGGGGNDTITALASAGITAATIAGGGGNDSLFVRVGAAGSNNNLILGDALNSIGEFDSADVISVHVADDALFSASTIQAGGGNDSVTLAGSAVNEAAAASVLVQLQLGNDAFTAQTGNVSALTIQAGAGNDYVAFNSGVADTLVNLGGDNDTIVFGTISGTVAGTTVYGDNGADLFTNGAVSASDTNIAARFAYASATQSTLSAMDTVNIGGGAGTTFALRYDAAALARANFITASPNGTAIASATNGIVSFENDAPSSLTARVEFLDANVGANRVAVFNNSNNDRQYLFIQGGASGIGDDLVVQLGTAGSVTGGTVTLAADNKSFTFLT